jgi:hypothetical protein
VLDAGAERVCFTLHTQPCDSSLTGDSAYCCSQLSAHLHKIAFETSYSCFDARAFYNVTINGNSEHFDVSAVCAWSKA